MPLLVLVEDSRYRTVIGLGSQRLRFYVAMLIGFSLVAVSIRFMLPRR